MQKYTLRKDDITSLLGATALENQVSSTYYSPKYSHLNSTIIYPLSKLLH